MKMIANKLKSKVLMLLTLVALLFLSAPTVHAQSNISQVITTVDGYFTAAVAVGIAGLLFVLGRRVLKKAI